MTGYIVEKTGMTARIVFTEFDINSLVKASKDRSATDNQLLPFDAIDLKTYLLL
jgi:hypothetical protein